MKLSILIPIKNEYPYICELLEQLLPLNRNDTEIIISDNYSDDGSWEYIQNFRNDIVITRPKNPCSEFKNRLNVLQHAKGEYIFSMGGDDIITKSAINIVVPHLKNNRIVIGQMECFDDETGKRIMLTNTRNDIERFFTNNIFSIHKYMSFINYDQLYFGFFPRDKQSFLYNLKPNTRETFCSWSNIFNFHNKLIQHITIIDEPLMRKRYNKTKYNNDLWMLKHHAYAERSFTIMTLNSLFNSFLFLIYYKDFAGFLQCLVLTRKKRGYYDNNNPKKIIKKIKNFGPLIMLFVTPLMDVFRIIKNSLFKHNYNG